MNGLSKVSVRITISLLIILELCSLFLVYKSFSNRKISEIKETNIVNSKEFAMYIEQDDGSYTEYAEGNLFTIDGYVFNLEKSNCVDNKGNVVNDVLSNSDNKITISSNKTSYCYLYFSKQTAVKYLLANAGADLWDSTLEDDGFRYVGTNPANYICFGTADKDTCVGNTDLYMYRIVGIFEDSDGKKHLKLIKKETLNTTYGWHSYNNVDIDWDESDLYTGINGSYFLTNTTYSYMQDTIWTNKITEWDYTATNTLTDESSGPHYNYSTTKSVYLHELNRSGKSSATCAYDSTTTADCSVGEWKTVTSKIGLMYASDYLLSLGSSALEYTSNSNKFTLYTGWIQLTNNDSVENCTEWTMTRYGAYNDTSSYFAMFIDSLYRVSFSYMSGLASVRPVFYLETDVEIAGGSGTSDDPYIIG